ncbi:recombinase family protein [Amaricoccus solimangrovi]|uniref:Recombinase family protein n=1 Tax=Amaricoccus solimangrovi TaxID=2589815 RepID=A0A501WJJ1_9RHOB|nr:recombinase family protein [Amaricoccus solimangrovi]TPE48942.1 recombinase family protein [Amaricoccus solimangrovi]
MSGGRAARKAIRRAIYTRKSTEEGLEQDFNSLDAQREACAAYVLSQKHEGWSALAGRYDDGGYSGGSMERPALRRLLADIEAGKIDAVVVYKVDRLTRSLADFARIVAIFDAAGVSFVSITQAFNTTTSMGRLTLNVLLSFAQFEREVTAERIPDKIAASKARGIWMGGTVPIGYRAEARTLVPMPGEAALVRRIFERYLALGSVSALRAELDAAGIRTPLRRHRDGRVSGGAVFSRGKLYTMLANPLFIGRIRHRDQPHPGLRLAIVAPELWGAARRLLAARRRARSARPSARDPSPLAGRLVDPDGNRMRPSHASKKGRRYRYYVSEALIENGVAHGARGWRVPAPELEAAVSRAIAARPREPALQARLLDTGTTRADPSATTIRRILELAERLDAPGPGGDRDLPRLLVSRVALTESALRAEVGFGRLAGAAHRPIADLADLDLPGFTVAAPPRPRRRGPELRIILGGAAAPVPGPDPVLLRTLVEARRRAADYLDAARGLTVSDIARREGVDTGDVSRSLQLAFLAPDLVARILDGTQPTALTAERLKRIDLPLRWADQRTLIG